jgi:hypothetical protein
MFCDYMIEAQNRFVIIRLVIVLFVIVLYVTIHSATLKFCDILLCAINVFMTKHLTLCSCTGQMELMQKKSRVTVPLSDSFNVM